MRYYKNGNTLIATMGQLDMPEITEAEYQAAVQEAQKREAVQAQIIEKTRPLTAEEAYAVLLTQQINTLSVDDNMALRMRTFYPEWAEGVEYAAGYKVQLGGKLWRVVQAHTSTAGWEPEHAAALWEQINETHAGTMDDPIPYEGNMALVSGLHYMQDYVIYRCTRDTGNPVYNPLADLVGLYVETV